MTVYTWDVLSVNAKPNETIIEHCEKMFESRISAGATEKNHYRDGKALTRKLKRAPTTWKDMLKNASTDTVNWQTRKWSNFTKFQVLAWMTINSRRKNSNQLENCQKFAHKSCSNVCTWHELDDMTFFWSVNKLARSVTKWTQACDRNTAQHCRLGSFQDSDCAGDLEDSKSTARSVLCISGSRTFVPVSWMCKKQTSVSESEIISLDAGLRMDGLPALDLRDK